MIAEIKTDTIVMFVMKEYIVIKSINGELMLEHHSIKVRSMRCHKCDKRGKDTDFIIGYDGRYRCVDCHKKRFRVRF